MVDVDTWLQAVDDTEWEQSQIQGFYATTSKTHYVRDCSKESRENGTCVIWELKCHDYNEGHDKMMLAMREAQCRIVADRYEELVGEKR